jgi:SAM-dependent methyltransferase
MMRPFSPFAKVQDCSWLTVGDVNGWDAARLMDMGAKNVTASDLSGIRLQHAQTEGLIQNYRVENAEALSLEDKSIDIVFCKEAFHHFPRPWLGMYEMLRVAKRAVLLIEPRDWIIDRGSTTISGPKGILKALSHWLRQKMGFAIPNQSASKLFRLGDKPNYEEVGNYVFSVSSREIEKVALGINLPAIAFLGLNDQSEEGLWKHEAIESNPEYLRLKNSLEKADKLSRAGIGGTSYLLIAVFVELPSPELTADLESLGWYVKKLDRNPYLR